MARGAVGAWLCVVATGACGGDTGGDTNAVREPSTTADAGTQDGGAGGGAATLREACEMACEAQSSCLGIPAEVCADECAAQAKSLPADCEDEARAEQECLAELSCDDAKAYALEGRRDHAVCGEAAQAYFAACTLGAGDLPGECEALCARSASCDALMGSEAACAERCTLAASSFDADFGEACSSAYLRFSACVAEAECVDVVDYQTNNFAPASCDEALSAVEQACQ